MASSFSRLMVSPICTFEVVSTDAPRARRRLPLSLFSGLRSGLLPCAGPALVVQTSALDRRCFAPGVTARRVAVTALAADALEAESGAPACGRPAPSAPDRVVSASRGVARRPHHMAQVRIMYWKT